MVQQFRPHEAARVKAGQYAGAVGRVVEIKPGARGDRVWLEIVGIFKGQPVSKKASYGADQLEHA